MQWCVSALWRMQKAVGLTFCGVFVQGGEIMATQAVNDHIELEELRAGQGRQLMKKILTQRAMILWMADAKLDNCLHKNSEYLKKNKICRTSQLPREAFYQLYWQLRDCGLTGEDLYWMAQDFDWDWFPNGQGDLWYEVMESLTNEKQNHNMKKMGRQMLELYNALTEIEAKFGGQDEVLDDGDKKPAAVSSPSEPSKAGDIEIGVARVLQQQFDAQQGGVSGQQQPVGSPLGAGLAQGGEGLMEVNISPDFFNNTLTFDHTSPSMQQIYDFGAAALARAAATGTNSSGASSRRSGGISEEKRQMNDEDTHQMNDEDTHQRPPHESPLLGAAPPEKVRTLLGSDDDDDDDDDGTNIGGGSKNPAPQGRGKSLTKKVYPQSAKDRATAEGKAAAKETASAKETAPAEESAPAKETAPTKESAPAKERAETEQNQEKKPQAKKRQEKKPQGKSKKRKAEEEDESQPAPDDGEGGEVEIPEKKKPKKGPKNKPKTKPKPGQIKMGSTKMITKTSTMVAPVGAKRLTRSSEKKKKDSDKDDKTHSSDSDSDEEEKGGLPRRAPSPRKHKGKPAKRYGS